MTLLGERGVQSDYECGHGLCVRHLAHASRRKESTQNAPFLISAEATKFLCSDGRSTNVGAKNRSINDKPSPPWIPRGVAPS